MLSAKVATNSPLTECLYITIKDKPHFIYLINKRNEKEHYKRIAMPFDCYNFCFRARISTIIYVVVLFCWLFKTYMGLCLITPPHFTLYQSTTLYFSNQHP